MHKVKILVLGPCQSGKTVIANFLADATETSGGDYHPTQGCRILEFEVNNVTAGSRTVNTEVELWDVSGDHKFEGCWPAIARDTNGVIFVFNPDEPNHDKELESWCSYFLSVTGLKTDQCVAFAYQKPGHTPASDDQSKLSAAMKDIPVVPINLDDDLLRDEFNNYLSKVISSASDKREQEENSILNSR